jgi:outer membrane protein assembly factor BamB
MKKISVTSFLIALLILAGCSETKEKLKGKREPFIIVGNSLKPDPALENTVVILPPAVDLKDWNHVGGNPSHLMPPVLVGNDLKKVWAENIGAGSDTYHRLITHPVVKSGLVYSMDIHGNVQARKVADGSVVWELMTSPEEGHSNTMGGGFAADGDVLYITTSFGEVWCVEAQSGKNIWTKQLETPIRAAPTVFAGRVYVVTVNNEIYALEAKTGDELWDYAGIVEPSSLLGGSAPAACAQAVVVALTSGEIYCLSPESGRMLWSDTMTPALRIDTVSSIAHIRARPIIEDNVVYLASHGGRIAAYELQTGKKIWAKEIGALRTPVLSGNFLFVITTNDDLVCLLKSTGQVRWATSLPRKRESEEVITWAGPIVVNNQLAMVSTSEQMAFVNVLDGTIDKTVNLESACQLSPIAADKTIFTLTDSGILQAWR